jgi:hypothetical protein
MENAYRSAYEENREAFENEVQTLEQSVKTRPEFASLQSDKHEIILLKWFSSHGLVRAGISQHPVGTLKELLDADQATSLDALAGRVGTVPGLLADILVDIQELGRKPEEEEREPRMRTWRPKAITKGMVIRKDEAMEIADEFRQELEEQFEEGIEEVIIQ